MDTHRYLDTPEAAEHLRTSVNTLKDLRHQKKGPPYIKRGRSVLYRLEDLDAWMESLTVGIKK